MIDKHQEADILRSLAETYQEMIETKEQNAGKLNNDAAREPVGARPVLKNGIHGKAYGAGAAPVTGNSDDRRAAAAAADKAARKAAAKLRAAGDKPAAIPSVGAVLDAAGELGTVAKRNREKRKKIEAAKKQGQG